MTIFYSPSTEGFYDTSVINYQTLPDDCVEITNLQRNEFIYEMNINHKMLVLEDGNLKLKNRPVVITWENIRTKRNQLLDNSDYTQVPDFPGDKEAWAEYRQALRDIPQKYYKPEDVVWPTMPNK
jgi:hypothetical protein